MKLCPKFAAVCVCLSMKVTTIFFSPQIINLIKFQNTQTEKKNLLTTMMKALDYVITP